MVLSGGAFAPCPQAGLTPVKRNTRKYMGMYYALMMLQERGRVPRPEFGELLLKAVPAGEEPWPVLESLIECNIVVVDGRGFVEFDSRAARWYAANELLEPPPPPERARWW